MSCHGRKRTGTPFVLPGDRRFDVFIKWGLEFGVFSSLPVSLDTRIGSHRVVTALTVNPTY